MEPRNVQKRSSPGGPISFIHLTVDGPVHLLVRESKAGWVSLHWSKNLAGSWTFKTMEEANQNVLRRFENLYAGHCCSDGCRPAGAAGLHESDDAWGMIHNGHHLP